MKVASFFGTIVAALAFGAATAGLAVMGARDGLRGHPVEAWLLGSIVTLGLAGPVVAGAMARYQRRRTLELAQYLGWFASDIRERIYHGSAQWQERNPQSGRLTLKDIGVHVYVKRRRAIRFWRYEFVRYARSATADRAPNPTYGVFTDLGDDAPAQGLPGITTRYFCRPRIDLMDDEHQRANKQAWDDWYSESDPKALGSDWERSAAARRNFSAIWAEPVPTYDGERVGTITVNVEREISDGAALLAQAGTDAILRKSARTMGLGIVNFIRL